MSFCDFLSVFKPISWWSRLVLDVYPTDFKSCATNGKLSTSQEWWHDPWSLAQANKWPKCMKCSKKWSKFRPESKKTHRFKKNGLEIQRQNSAYAPKSSMNFLHRRELSVFRFMSILQTCTEILCQVVRFRVETSISALLGGVNDNLEGECFAPWDETEWQQRKNINLDAHRPRHQKFTKISKNMSFCDFLSICQAHVMIQPAPSCVYPRI